MSNPRCDQCGYVLDNIDEACPVCVCGLTSQHGTPIHNKLTREQIIEDARKALQCVFLAAEQGPAQDIHDKGNAAITYLETENTALRTRLAACEAERDDARKKFDDLTAIVIKNNVQVQSVQRNIELEKQLATAEAKVRELEAQLQLAQADLHDLEITVPHSTIIGLRAELKQAHEREGRLLHAIGEVFRYLNELDKEVPIKPQKHLDLWPWKELNEQAQQAGS